MATVFFLEGEGGAGSHFIIASEHEWRCVNEMRVRHVSTRFVCADMTPLRR